jgi:hypothetical protein
VEKREEAEVEVPKVVEKREEEEVEVPTEAMECRWKSRRRTRPTWWGSSRERRQRRLRRPLESSNASYFGASGGMCQDHGALLTPAGDESIEAHASPECGAGDDI